MIWDTLLVVCAVAVLGSAYISFALWLDRRTRRQTQAEDWIKEGNIRPRW